MVAFYHSLQSEWLKRKRSLASWLVVIGALFTPFMGTVINILRPDKLPERYIKPDFWEGHFRNSWEPMNVMLLPLGIILAVSLVTQLEYKNTAWKQLHTTPQPFHTIFLSKFTVLMIMQGQLFVLFSLAMILSALIPAAVLSTVPFPTEAIPIADLVKSTCSYFVGHLPIVAIQFLLALQFRNFLVSLGAGIILMISGILLISWEHSYTHPYLYATLMVIKRFPEKNLLAWSIGWFVPLMAVGYILYLRKTDKS